MVTVLSGFISAAVMEYTFQIFHRGIILVAFASVQIHDQETGETEWQ